MKKILILNGAAKKNGNTVAMTKVTVNNFTDRRSKQTALLMTSGGSTINHMMDWYKNFEHWLGWKSIGETMNDLEEAKRIGASIS
jgi:hypothetical protein